MHSASGQLANNMLPTGSDMYRTARESFTAARKMPFAFSKNLSLYSPCNVARLLQEARSVFA
jgi:hypothetical protein